MAYNTSAIDKYLLTSVPMAILKVKVNSKMTWPAVSMATWYQSHIWGRRNTNTFNTLNPQSHWITAYCFHRQRRRSTIRQLSIAMVTSYHHSDRPYWDHKRDWTTTGETLGRSSPGPARNWPIDGAPLSSNLHKQAFGSYQWDSSDSTKQVCWPQSQIMGIWLSLWEACDWRDVVT